MRHLRSRRYASFMVVASAGLLFGCAEMVGRSDDSTALPKQLRARQVVVTLAGPDLQQRETFAQALSSRYQLRETGSFPLDSIGVQCVVFDVPADRQVDDVIKQLRIDPRVESAQLNEVFEGAQDRHNDPYAKLEYGAAAIRADVAHSISTGEGVRITVVDTGVDVNHPDLRGRISKIANFVDGGESSFATDRHGTAVTGIIGARADDAIGIFGVAPDAELLVAKACWYADRAATKALCSSWTLAKAIDFAIRERTRVLNLSLKGPSDALLKRLLLAAEARGIAVVAAAAEEGSDPGFPAAFESVIAVIASDAKGDIRPLGWLNGRFAIAAPGVDILTTTPGGGYDFVSGSSFSAAEVSGVVALLIEQRPGLEPREIRDLLRRSARPLIVKAETSADAASGLIDACAALNELLAASACP